MPFFESPVGKQADRNAGQVWPTNWHDANPYGTPYDVKPGKPAIHTGADLNSDLGDENAPLYAMGDGIVIFAGLWSLTAWGNLIVIDHGVVDGKLLFSRYGHVQRIPLTIKEGKKVLKGEEIARIGNGGAALNFDFHLHFDISTTDKLQHDKGFWPGNNLDLVHQHFVDPFVWLQETHVVRTGQGQRTSEKSIPGASAATAGTELRFVIHPDGAQVRKNHSTSAELVHELKQGSQLLLKTTGGGNQDGFTWAQISGGEFDGCWVAICKKDAQDPSDFYLSKHPPQP